MKQILRSLPLIFAIVIIASYRLLPHPWNFTPVCAAAIFGGLYLPRWAAFSLPIASMVMADVFLGMDWIMTPVIYVSILGSVFAGIWARGAYGQKSRYGARIIGGTLASAVVFFLVTNFVAWLTLPQYTKDLTGLLHSYTLALPFFGNTVAGDVFFVTIFVVAYELIKGLSLSYLAPRLGSN